MEAKLESSTPCNDCPCSVYHCGMCEIKDATINAVYNPERLEEARSEMSKIIHAYRRAKANNSKRLEN